MEIRPVQSFVVPSAAVIGILIVLRGIVSRRVQAERHSGAVYVLSNESTGNEVIAYRRAPDGTLTMSGSFSTGGEGTTSTGPDPWGHKEHWCSEKVTACFLPSMPEATKSPSLRWATPASHLWTRCLRAAQCL